MIQGNFLVLFAEFVYHLRPKLSKVSVHLYPQPKPPSTTHNSDSVSLYIDKPLAALPARVSQVTPGAVAPLFRWRQGFGRPKAAFPIKYLNRMIFSRHQYWNSRF